MADDTIKVDILTDSTSSTKSMIKYAAAIGGAYLAITKVVNISKELINAYKESEKAEAKLAATLKATGNAAGFSVSQLKDYASSLQDITTFDDDVIVSGLAVLSTFKSIQGDAFKRTTEAALDLSAVMGQDLQSSMVQLGKAVENPTVGLTALSRVGVTFTDQEKEQIKALQESNNLREAQAVILSAVEGQFKGAAKAIANTPTGKLDQLNNAIGDLKEALGGALVQGLAPYASGMKTIVENTAEAIGKANVLKAALDRVRSGEAQDLDRLTLLENNYNKLQADKIRMIKEAAVAGVRGPEAQAALQKKIDATKALLDIEVELEQQRKNNSANVKQESTNAETKAARDKKIADELKATKQLEYDNKIALDALYITSQEEYYTQMAEQDRAYVAEKAAQQEQERADTEEHFNALTDHYNNYTTMMMDTFAALGERMGESIIEQESMWDATGEIIKGAIAGIIRAIGSEAFVQAAKSMAQAFAWMSIPGGQGYAGKAFAAAAKWTAAGTMANVAAGMVNAKFAQGGEFITSGPQAIMVGDNATGRERVKVEPLGAGGDGSRTLVIPITLNGRELGRAITLMSKDGTIITSARSVR